MDLFGYRLRQSSMRKVLGEGAAALVLMTACVHGLSGSPSELPTPTRADFRTLEAKRGTKFWPRSARVETGVEYSFDTGHCGLGSLTDFDGSFWRPIDGTKAKEPSFFYNEDRGTMTLVSHDRAIYRASTGQRVSLHRHRGTILRVGACA
jgi:hypothetical protein